MEMNLDGPAGPAPPGVVPNFDDPSSLRTWWIFTMVLTMTLATLAVTVRMYTKAFIIRSFAYEDYALLLGWVLAVVLVVPSSMISKHGGGRHIWDVQLKELFQFSYWVNINSTVYGFSIYFIKLSILLQYLRIFVPDRKTFFPMFLAVQIWIWILTVYYLISNMFEIFMCNPREKIWNPTVPGRCFNQQASFESTGIVNIITDFALLILPMPSLWKLQMPLKRKIGIMLIFATAALGCATSIVRVYYTWKVIKTPDATYTLVIMGAWAWAEEAVGIIVSCAPVMPGFFGYVGPKLYNSLAHSSLTRTLLGRNQSSSDQDLTAKEGMNFEKPKKSSLKHLEHPDLVTTVDGDTSSTDKKSDVTLNEDLDQDITAIIHGSATKREDLEFGDHRV